jgi:hypothetical protein
MTGKSCPECNYVKDNNGELNMKTIVLDGLNVIVNDDQSASIIQRVVDGLTTQLKGVNDALEDLKKKKADADKEVTDAKTAVSAKDGEIAVLKQQLKDAEVTPAKLDALVKDRQTVIDSATRLLGKEFAFDGKSLGEIKRAAVAVKLGDAATKMDEAAIGGAFQALCADGTDRGGTQPIRDAMAGHRPGFHAQDQRTSAHDEYVKSLGEAYKNTSASVQ